MGPGKLYSRETTGTKVVPPPGGEPAPLSSNDATIENEFDVFVLLGINILMSGRVPSMILSLGIALIQDTAPFC